MNVIHIQPLHICVLMVFVHPSIALAASVIGGARPLAFASEVAVASEPIIKPWQYKSLWGLSIVAVAADAGVKIDAAPEGKGWHMAAYQAAFHIPASLVIPAVIIHKIVHMVPSLGIVQSLPPKFKTMAPVLAAIASIPIVVPAVDHSCEWALDSCELHRHLGLPHPHHDGAASGDKTVN